MSEIKAVPKEQQTILTMDNIGTRKIFVLDTNVLIHNPQALFSFADNVVVIPIVVIEEIDNFKKGLDEKGRNARQIGRNLDKIRAEGSLKDGVQMENNGYIMVAVSHDIETELKKVFLTNINDNQIIATALYYKNKYPQTKVVLISKDANVRIKADAVGLIAENYETESIVFEELYSGVKDIYLPAQQWQEYKEKQYLPVAAMSSTPTPCPPAETGGAFYANQFVRIYKEGSTPPLPPITEGGGDRDTAQNGDRDIAQNGDRDIAATADEHLCGRYSEENQAIYPLAVYKRGTEIFGITPRNEEQEFAFDILLDDSIKMVSLVGKAGTGKTLLAIAAGLHQVVEENKYTRLVVSRPISPLGKDIGFLPGSKADKFNPWMQPIYDNMEILLSSKEEKTNAGGKTNGKVFGKKGHSLQDYLEFGFIELEPLTYIRGRSLPNQYIIIDEAQNLTPHEMKTIITRAGEGTKIVITGDPYQIDIPYLDSESNGLSMCAEKLKTEPLIAHITLKKGERSTLANIAAKYF